MSGPVLQALGLRRAYDGWGLHDVSLSVGPGQALGVTGRAGAGKSTLARLLALLEAPDAGQILLEGRPIGQIAPRGRARHPARGAVQMLLQDAPASLIAHWTGQDLLADTAARLRPGHPVSDAISEACTAAGFEGHLLGRLPHQLSRGQAVRLALARALIARPKVLVLDEPTAALDASLRAGLMLRLDALRRETGVALIVISHDLHLIRLMCRQMLVLEAGRVAEAGATADLLAAPAHPATQALVGAMARI